MSDLEEHDSTETAKAKAPRRGRYKSVSVEDRFSPAECAYIIELVGPEKFDELRRRYSERVGLVAKT